MTGRAVPAATGWLHRRNPTVKLVLVFVVSFANLFLFDLRVLGLLYAAAVAGILACRAVSPRTLLLGHVPFLLFGIGLVAVNWMSRPEHGLVIGLALALRGLVIGVLSIAFITTTPPRDLMVSLVQHARLSPRFAYPLLAGHRMLQTMPSRWGTIRAAQSVRAPRNGKGRARFGLREFAQASFALLVGSIRASEQARVPRAECGAANQPPPSAAHGIGLGPRRRRCLRLRCARAAAGPALLNGCGDRCNETCAGPVAEGHERKHGVRRLGLGLGFLPAPVRPPTVRGSDALPALICSRSVPLTRCSRVGQQGGWMGTWLTGSRLGVRSRPRASSRTR